MNKENKSVVLLITTDKQRFGTQTVIHYSGIFVEENRLLDSVEANVFDMVRTHPDCWTCGCVTGYPESLFTEVEREALRRHGINKRFSL